MKIAAYQAPLLPSGSLESLELIRKQIDRCESEGVSILCCPEGVLGGLADYAEHPGDFAIRADAGELEALLAPLESDSVTTILGFTEITRDHRLYNSAAILHMGSVLGVYRKLYPAIRRSVYSAGEEIPIFQADGLTFGVIICLDSNYIEPARIMAIKGATALFIPTNNGLPPEKADSELPALARRVDIARAIDNAVSVIRADVAGRTENLISYGASEIIAPDGRTLQSARSLQEDLIIAEIETSLSGRGAGNASENKAVVDEYARLAACNRERANKSSH